MAGKRSAWISLAALLAAIAVILFTVLFPSPPGPAVAQSPFLQRHVRWADSVYQTLDLNQRLALMVWVAGPEQEIAEGCLTDGFAAGWVLDQQEPPTLTEMQALRYRSRLPLSLVWAVQDTGYLARESWLSLQDSSYFSDFGILIGKMAREAGINHVLFSHHIEYAHPAEKKDRARAFTQASAAIQQQGVLAAARETGAYYPTVRDTVLRDSLLAPYQILAHGGVTTFALSPQVVRSLPPASRSMRQVAGYWERRIQFQGICLALPDTAAEWDANFGLMALRSGADALLIRPVDIETAHGQLRQWVERGFLSEEEVKSRGMRLLMAKRWTEVAQQTPETTVRESGSADALAARRRKGAVFLAYDSLRLVPLYTSSPFIVADRRSSGSLLRRAAWYGPLSVRPLPLRDDGSLLPLSVRDFKGRRETVLVLPMNWQERSGKQAFLTSLEEVAAVTRLILVHAGPGGHLVQLPKAAALLHSPDTSDQGLDALAQALFGGSPITGRPWFGLWGNLPSQAPARQATRLGWSIPQEMNVDANFPARIASIAREAIDEFTTPGCQVLVAYKGQIIHQEAYGYHTYVTDRPVMNTDLYDIASVTKVAATTLAAMHLVDTDTLDLKAPLSRFFPGWAARLRKPGTEPVTDTLPKSADSLPTLATDSGPNKKPPLKPISFFDLTPYDLLIHHSGLPASMNLNDYLNYRKINPEKGRTFYQSRTSEIYPLPVAANFYFRKDLRDSLMVSTFRLEPNPAKSYVYSDINMVLMKWIMDSLSRQPFERMLKERFYDPLGLQHTRFLPLDQFEKDRIPPTEFDQQWRRQLVQGYVHDPTAALMGGISGNAGLFSNTYDLAVLYQLWLNGGVYGGRRYLSSKVVRMFTTRQLGHRAIGFDMSSPGELYVTGERVSNATFGHSGFTGIGAWADPELDLVFIFISNRVHPKASPNKLNELRIRQRMQDVATEAVRASLR